MSNDPRRSVVAALVALAGSRDHSDRADAGRSLASFAEMPEAQGPLMQLVLDTFVTRATTEVLLRRRDSAGLKVIASALEVLHWLRDTVYREDKLPSPHRIRTPRHGRPTQPHHRCPAPGRAP